MRLVMTLMVRDEADVVAAMVEHHLAQGVDLIIATDNGSVDGTREILARYAELGKVELHDDPVHAKQQNRVVTQMARRAFTEHGADWVVNADADEFWVPVDRSITLREAFEHIPASLGSFTVPVVNLTGTPARHGTGLSRLVWRDQRPDEALAEEAGLRSQPTPDAVHVGSADVTVAQGNHFVDIESTGEPEAPWRLEVLHLPWRSLDHHAAKVEMSGRAYEESPNLRPSANHHGMRDYRRLKAGYVEEFYLYRHPVDPSSRPEAFVHDDTVLTSVRRLADDGALAPDLLRPLLDDAGDEPFDTADLERGATLAHTVIPVESQVLAAAARLDEMLLEEILRGRRDRAAAKDEEKRLRAKVKAVTKERDELRRTSSRPTGARRVVGAVRRRLRR